jgi:hypothetical protein
MAGFSVCVQGWWGSWWQWGRTETDFLWVRVPVNLHPNLGATQGAAASRWDAHSRQSSPKQGWIAALCAAYGARYGAGHRGH